MISSSNLHRIAFPSYIFFWFSSFSFALIMALLLQKVVLPMFPELHAGHGLLKNDAVIFHNMAVEIAKKINETSWSEWQIYPKGATGNVALLSALYAIFGTDPSLFLPLSAAAHATGALLIFQIGTRLVDNEVGKLGSMISAICFLVFPSALAWYGQNHKDAFAIVGILLALDAWLIIHAEELKIRFWSTLEIVIKVVSGVVLLGLVRPHFVLILLLGFFASFLISSIARSKADMILIRFIFIALISVMATFFTQRDIGVGVYAENLGTLNLSVYKIDKLDRFVWKETNYVPVILEKTLHRASELRLHFYQHGRYVGANSEIDGDQLPDSALKAIAYLPRALFVGLFAPFPETWAERTTLPRLIAAIETFCWYLAFFGAVKFVIRYRNRKILAGVIFAATLITIISYVSPNVGTLYRQRYALWHFFMLIGCIGWANILYKKLFQSPSSDQIYYGEQEKKSQKIIISSVPSRSAGSGSLVILITIVSYLGFFIRDLLLTSELGLVGDLDVFFLIMVITMFFVSCIALPIGDAMILPFIKSIDEDFDKSKKILQGTLAFLLILLIGVTLIVEISAPWIVSLILNFKTSNLNSVGVNLLRWYALIIGLSGFTIIGNAALNSLGKPQESSLGQLVVPVVIVAAILIFPKEQIIVNCLVATLVGMIINIIFLFIRLRIHGLILLPLSNPISETVKVRSLYFPLVAAAILPAALVPMNFSFAANEAMGSAAAWAFASKVVVLFSGFSSILATFLVLPKTARRLIMIVGNNRSNQDENFNIVIGVWLGGMVMLGGFIFAEPLIGILLGNQLLTAQISQLADIVKVGFMQIPIAVVGVVVNKMAIASGRNSILMYASLSAFVVNLIVNLLLVSKIGIIGVAIGSLVGGAISLVIVFLDVYRTLGISNRDINLVLASWFAWFGVCIGIYFDILVILFIAFIALMFLFRLQFTAFNENRLNKI